MSDLPRILRARAAGVFALKADAEAMEAAADALEAAEAKLAAIDALHQPDSYDDWVSSYCGYCDDEFWPCPTHRFIHPEETA